LLAYQLALSIFTICCILSYLYFFFHHKDHLQQKKN
jgi:hypothetical protein